MKDKYVNLTIHQGFALVSRIEELKKNPYFRDPISESFIEDVCEQSTNITVNSINTVSNVLQKLRKNGDKIKISASKFEYVTRLTGIDVFDEKFMTQYIGMVNEIGSTNSDNHPKLR